MRKNGKSEVGKEGERKKEEREGERKRGDKERKRGNWRTESERQKRGVRRGKRQW